MLPVLFAFTLFLSAALLFLVQPLLGKLLLPLLGGTPAVWNTCLVFFQTLLLAGYLYVHVSTDRLGVRRQARWHLLLLLLPLGAFLLGWHLFGSPVPVLASLIPVEQDYPLLPVLTLLFVAVGPAFFVLSTTGPMLQRWMTTTCPDQRDPYVLYAASNAGSLLGLLAYPFLVEPTLSLTTQQALWSFAVVGYCVLILLGALATISTRPSLAVLGTPIQENENPLYPQYTPSALSRSRILRWLALSALTAGLLNAVTAHLTTDMAPMPLLWVVPLALYLLSFILVFWHWPVSWHRLLGRVVPMLILFLVVVLVTRATDPVWLVLALHLGVFLAILLLCHGELAQDRPPGQHLTAFYLYLSLGGVLGSLGCALIAPLVFHRLGVVEYPLLLVLAALVRPGVSLDRLRPSDLLSPGVLGVITATLVFLVPGWLGPAPSANAPEFTTDRLLRTGLMFGMPAIGAYFLVDRPIRYALALAVLLILGALDPGPNGFPLHIERNFFGTIRVTRSPDGKFIRLIHGTTQHGQQRLDDDTLKPLMYYHPTGPAGRVLKRLPDSRRRRVGAVGLGCGAMAWYAQPGEEWTFFEIDPAVIRIAQDTNYFTYLDRCKGNLRIVPGDARRQLEREPDGMFDVLILDAFSSDAIPVHLLTREAFALYLRKLAPQGVILFHVSNRYLDLPPLLARLAADHHPPLLAWVDHNIPTGDQQDEGKWRSTWVLLARQKEDLTPIERDRNWQPIPEVPGPVWTDTFSNLLGVWKTQEED